MINSSFPYLGTNPQVEVLILSTFGDWRPFLCHVDSGAFISVLTREDATHLGFKLFDGNKINLYGIGGSLTAYIHPVTLKIAGKELRTEIAFSISNETPRLLGRKGVFSHFTICFDDKHQLVTFS